MSPSSSHDGHQRSLATLLLIGGLVGCASAFVLTVEKFNLLADPSHTPSCNLNPIVSCGSVMSTAQASAFGFPNPLLGIGGFTVVAATGAAILAGAKLARWYWASLQLGVTFGMLFVAWLIFQSIYRIGALCPYCMVVWAVMLPIFWCVTRRNVLSGVFGQQLARSPLLRAVADWGVLILTSVYLLVLGLITHQFWFYWSTLV